jgi:hypothetical protein
MKVIFDKLTEDSMLNGRKASIISSKIRNKTKMHISAMVIQHRIGNLSQSNKTREKKKGHSHRKGGNHAIHISS